MSRAASATDVRFRAAVAELMDGIRPDFWVTFVTNRSASIAGFERKVFHWQAHVDRELLGPRWQGLSSNRTMFVGIVEHVTTNIHMHAGVCVPSKAERFRAVASRNWEKLVPSGNLDIQEYKSLGAATYSSKDIRASYSERIILSPNASFRD